MNSIEELLDVIKSFGGKARIVEIYKYFEDDYCRRLSEKEKEVIRKTLSTNKSKVFVNENKEWEIVTAKRKDITHTSHSKSTIICRVAYMKYYQGITDEDKPVNGGQYVKDTGDATEKFNFVNFDGKCLGFVETKHTKGNDNELHIENIAVKFEKKFKAEDVRVVFVATRPCSSQVVVGWYDNATVYRERNHYMIGNYDHVYNLTCNYENAYLIPESRREFVIPNAFEEKNDFGMGQANIWYFQNNEKAEELSKKLNDYIDNFVM